MHPENLDALIHHHLLEVLKACGGNKRQAAIRLGISRSSVYRLLDMASAQARPANRIRPPLQK